jgi:hypothetical protein
MLLFRSEEHVRRWCSQWGQAFGSILSLDQAWLLAQAWYSEDRRKTEWRRKTKEEAQALFERLGLLGPFWQL